MITYGKNSQVRFKDIDEKQEALEYLKYSDNVRIVHERNDLQGAWAAENRFIIKEDDPLMPDGVRNNLTAGNSGCFGRINCGDLVDRVRRM